MPIVVKTVTVPALGVGRKDYSTNVEMSVEPLIRSWQEEYQFYDTFVVPAGYSVTREIDIPTQTVVMMYDVYLSTTLNALLHLLRRVLHLCRNVCSTPCEKRLSMRRCPPHQRVGSFQEVADHGHKLRGRGCDLLFFCPWHRNLGNLVLWKVGTLMGSVKRFSVSALGVGRKDYSVNVEASVEAMIRSHQLRVTWNLIAEDVPTLAFPECYWLSLFFMNYAGGLVLVAPSDVRYAIYGLSVSGRLNALTICGLDQFESIIPGPVFDMPVGHIKTVARAFGFSKAELSLAGVIHPWPGERMLCRCACGVISLHFQFQSISTES